MSNSFKPGMLVRYPLGLPKMEFPAFDGSGRPLESPKNELYDWVSIEPGQIGLCVGCQSEMWYIVLFGEDFVQMLSIDLEAV